MIVGCGAITHGSPCFLSFRRVVAHLICFSALIDTYLIPFDARVLLLTVEGDNIRYKSILLEYNTEQENVVTTALLKIKTPPLRGGSLFSSTFGDLEFGGGSLFTPKNLSEFDRGSLFTRILSGF